MGGGGADLLVIKAEIVLLQVVLELGAFYANHYKRVIRRHDKYIILYR